MKQQDNYIAKEVFTFPLICLACLTSFIYWGCTDGWPVGVIIGTSFFGIITLVYIFKYLRFGLDFLRIDADGIAYKAWSKTTSLKWSEIEKCEVYYRTSPVSASLFARDLYIFTKQEKDQKQQKQYTNVILSGKYCRNKSVIDAIKRFGGTVVFDEQSSHSLLMARDYMERVKRIILYLFQNSVIRKNRHSSQMSDIFGGMIRQ